MKDKDSIFIFSHSFLGLSVARCRLSSLSFRSPQKFSSNATLSGLNTSWWITNLRHAVFLTKHSIHVLTCDENVNYKVMTSSRTIVINSLSQQWLSMVFSLLTSETNTIKMNTHIFSTNYTQLLGAAGNLDIYVNPRRSFEFISERSVSNWMVELENNDVLYEWSIHQDST